MPHTRNTVVALALLIGCALDPSPTRTPPPRAVPASPLPSRLATEPSLAPPAHELADRCEAFVQHLAECGTALPHGYCALFGSQKNPGATERFECFTETPCGAVTDRCAPGDAVAALDLHTREHCGDRGVSEDLRALIDLVAASGRPDRMAALRVCELLPTCDALTRCLEIWTDAIER